MAQTTEIAGPKVQSSSTRLWVILARKAHAGVVFRRGPSKRVLLLRWRTDTHELEAGQWLKGRIYERRCDLSPTGEKLVYFAANHKPPHFTWTALSRPPFLTAIALWPKGDAWGGGGLFRNERTLLLNHRPGDETKSAPDQGIPRNLEVLPFESHSGWGEDDPIWTSRMQRDGWTIAEEGEEVEHPYGSDIWYEFSPPRIFTKVRSGLTLEMRIVGIKQLDGPWVVVEHRVRSADGATLLDLGRSDWADWSLSGELLFARAGCLCRARIKRGRTVQLEPAETLFDLSGMRFEGAPAPPEAKQWGGRRVRGRPVARFSTESCA